MSATKVLNLLLISSFFLFWGCSREITRQSALTHTLEGNRFIAGDALKIFIPLDTASFLNGTYPIDYSGFVVLPVAGRVKVTDLSPAEFTAYIQKTFEQYIRYPEVMVIPLIRVSLLGGFKMPGMYYVEPQRSVWDLISMAGGTNHERGLRKLVWERDRRVIRNNLIPCLESGESLSMLGFRSGDQIWTPTENRNIREILVREVLPFATFALSLYLGIMTLRNDN
jgi:protein involved in polysaccharide export with SLBB domain